VIVGACDGAVVVDPSSYVSAWGTFVVPACVVSVCAPVVGDVLVAHVPDFARDSAGARVVVSVALRDWQSLSEPERLLVAFGELRAEVNNGGFDQYFFNSP
jgi:hypothetical protein